MNEQETTKRKYSVISVIKRMLNHMWNSDRAQFGRIAVYTAVLAVTPFMSVLLPKVAIGILEQGGEDVTENLIITMGIYFVIAGALAIIGKYLAAYIQTRNMRIRLMYLGEMTRKLMKMDYSHHEDAKFWEEYEKGINAGNNNANGIEGLYNKLADLPGKFLTLVGMIILAGMLSPVLLLSLVVHVLVVMWAAKKTHDYEYSKKQELAKADRRIGYYKRTTQDFSFGKDIRIFNLRERIMANYQAEIDALVAIFTQIRKREYALSFASLFTLLISNVLTYGILIYEVLNGMPVSTFSMYITLITSLMALMVEFGNDLAFVWNEGEYVDDYYRLMDEKLIVEGDKTKSDVLKTPEGRDAEGIDSKGKRETLEIVFDHVSFCYPHTEKNVFTDLNFTIHAGESLAIVGVNGAGKSTLVKLITGMFQPTEGHIYINGVDITDLKKSELYDLYSAVFQDVNVLAFSIRENVGCASEGVDDQRVRIALEKVGLGEKVDGFEKGLDQVLLKVIDENGTDFSGGERQKLSIARGLYKDAPMVIMDEPTAALDALAEAEIYESFSNLVEGKTALYISHRLASTRFCDKIALFDADGLIEYGTHEELMEMKGKYYEMFVVQGKYYQEEAV